MLLLLLQPLHEHAAASSFILWFLGLTYRNGILSFVKTFVC